MKLLLACIAMILTVAACNSKKESGKEVEKTDTGNVVPATVTPPMEKDLDSEGVGELLIGTKVSKVFSILGEPSSKSKEEEWGADGLMHQDLFFKDKGVQMNLSRDSIGAEQVISSITIFPPSTLKTKRGIGIGSTHEEVLKAYEGQIDPTTNKTSIIIGSIYGGIVMDVDNNKVSRIFVGAAAE